MPYHAMPRGLLKRRGSVGKARRAVSASHHLGNPSGDEQINSMAGTRPNVVIVGAGFGGIEAAKALRRAPVDVTLIDRQNHHCFQPLLYQVATAALSPADIAWPIRHILRGQDNATVLLAEVVGVDIAGRRVLLSGAEPLPYDQLVIAT